MKSFDKALKKKRDPKKEYKVTDEAKFHHSLDKSLHKYDYKKKK